MSATLRRLSLQPGASQGPDCACLRLLASRPGPSSPLAEQALLDDALTLLLEPDCTPPPPDPLPALLHHFLARAR